MGVLCACVWPEVSILPPCGRAESRRTLHWTLCKPRRTVLQSGCTVPPTQGAPVAPRGSGEWGFPCGPVGAGTNQACSQVAAARGQPPEALSLPQVRAARVQWCDLQRSGSHEPCGKSVEICWCPPKLRRSFCAVVLPLPQARRLCQQWSGSRQCVPFGCWLSPPWTLRLGSRVFQSEFSTSHTRLPVKLHTNGGVSLAPTPDSTDRLN